MQKHVRKQVLMLAEKKVRLWKGCVFVHDPSGKAEKRRMVEQLREALWRSPLFRGIDDKGTKRLVRLRSLKPKPSGRLKRNNDLMSLMQSSFVAVFGKAEKSNQKSYYGILVGERNQFVKLFKYEWDRLRFRRKSYRKRPVLQNSTARKFHGQLLRLLFLRYNARLRDHTSRMWTFVDAKLWWLKRCYSSRVFDTKLCSNVLRVWEEFVGSACVQLNGGRRSVGLEEIGVKSYNCDGIKARLSDVVHNVISEGVDVVCLQELKLIKGNKPKVGRDLELITHNRPGDATGGGTGFLIRRKLRYEVLPSTWRRFQRVNKKKKVVHGAEWAWIRLRASNGWIYLCSFYSPPAFTVSKEIISKLFSQVHDFVGRRETVGCLIMGDFNSPLIDVEVLRAAGHGALNPVTISRGKKWKSFLEEDRVWLLNSLFTDRVEATHHLPGSRSVIDYAIWCGEKAIVKSFEVKSSATTHSVLSAKLDGLALSETI